MLYIDITCLTDALLSSSQQKIMPNCLKEVKSPKLQSTSPTNIILCSLRNDFLQRIHIQEKKKQDFFFGVCVGGLVTGDMNMRAAIFCIHYTLS